jgi:hypothetical protein
MVNEELANSTRAPRRRAIFLKFSIKVQGKRYKSKTGGTGLQTPHGLE